MTRRLTAAVRRLLRGAQPVWWVAAFAAFLALLGAAAIVVGGHDAALARADLGVTATAALLLATGAVLLIAAYQLAKLSDRRSWKGGVRPPCKLPVLAAFFVTIFLGLYVLFAALGTSGGQRAVVVSVAVLLIAAALAGLGAFARDVSVTLSHLGGALALGLVGTGIGLWEFWYQHQYAPSHAGRAVELDAALHLEAPQKDYDVVRATLTYKNVSANGVSVIGSTYTLTGSRVVHCERRSTRDVVRQVFVRRQGRGFLVDPQRSRYMADVFEEQPPAVLAAGKFVGDGKRLDATLSASRDLVFFVPRHRYQLLRLRAQLFAIPASVPLSQRTLPTYRYDLPRDHEVYGFWHVDDDSWVHDLVYGRERWVVLRYELVDPEHKLATQTSPDLRVTARFPAPSWTKRPPSDTRVERLFDHPEASDASEPFADAELPLEQVGEPTAADDRKLEHAGCAGR